MKCRNCKADNKIKSICDAGIVCYVLRCGEYGCALNGKTVNKLLRMKKATTNGDRIRTTTDEELAEALCLIYGGLGPVQSDDGRAWLDWLRQEVQE